MSTQSAQTSSGTRPARIARPKSLQPTQKPKIDSSPEATTIATSSPSARPSRPKPSAATAPAVVMTAPMPCAKRFGGPDTYLGGPSRGATTAVASRPSGLSVGPVSTRAMKPTASTASSQ